MGITLPMFCAGGFLATLLILTVTVICISEATADTCSSSKQCGGRRGAAKGEDPPSEIQLQFPDNTQALLFSDNGRYNSTIRLTRHGNSSKFRILLHLVSCSYDVTDYVEISWPNGTSVHWNCSEFDRYNNQTLEERRVIAVLDNIREVTVTPRFEGDLTDPGSSYKYATLVANLYQDMDDSFMYCPTGLASCNVNQYVNDCSRSCRSKAALFKERHCEHDKCRCIPSQLTCNRDFNCGWNTFEESEPLCRTMELCHCGTLGVTTILIICAAWMALIAVSVGVYYCVRTSASLLATFDIVVTLLILILWNLGGQLLTVPDTQASMVIGTILLCIHMTFAIWLYVGNRQAQHLTTALTFSLIYLTANTFLLFVSLVAVTFYFGFSAHLFSHEDARLWVSAVASGCRLTCLFSVLHYIKVIHKRLSRT